MKRNSTGSSSYISRWPLEFIATWKDQKNVKLSSRFVEDLFRHLSQIFYIASTHVTHILGSYLAGLWYVMRTTFKWTFYEATRVDVIKFQANKNRRKFNSSSLAWSHLTNCCRLRFKWLQSYFARSRFEISGLYLMR